MFNLKTIIPSLLLSLSMIADSFDLLAPHNFDTIVVVSLGAIAFITAIIGIATSNARQILTSERGPAHLFFYTAMGLGLVVVLATCGYIYSQQIWLAGYIASLFVCLLAGWYLFFAWGINRLRISIEGEENLQ